MQTLRDTVAIYGTGIGGGFDNLDPVLNGLILTSAEIDDITAFMHALTDPRVAAETFPFDRPTLRFERAQAIGGDDEESKGLYSDAALRKEAAERNAEKERLLPSDCEHRESP